MSVILFVCVCFLTNNMSSAAWRNPQSQIESQFSPFGVCVCIFCIIMLEHLSVYIYIYIYKYIHFFFLITFSISMYIMCLCLFSTLSRRVGALQISIIIIKGLIYSCNCCDWPNVRLSTNESIFPVHSQSASTRVCSKMAMNIVNRTSECDVPQKEFYIQNVKKKKRLQGVAPLTPLPNPPPSKLFSFLPSHIPEDKWFWLFEK